MGRSIDINSDLGEGAGHDPEIMRFVSSANIACGGHAGDEDTMRETVRLAKKHGVSIGAHPGYPDKANFGREAMQMGPLALSEEVAAQVRALAEIANTEGASLRHVKAHGALYNQAAHDKGIASAIASGIYDDARGAMYLVFAMPGSALLDAARGMDLRIAREGFIDRAYEADGTLRSRKLDGALHTDPKVAAAQVVSFLRDGGVRTHDGSFLPMEVDTLCFHGDTPGVLEIAAAVRDALRREGIEVRPPA